MSETLVVAGHPAAVAVIGLGNVGRALLVQLSRLAAQLPSLRVQGVSNSRRMSYDPKGVDLERWERALDERGEDADLDRLVDAVARDPARVRVVVDLTASPAVADRHARWLAAGLHVVTANKLAAARGLGADRALRRAVAFGGARYLASATVGAGLPVLRALERLHLSGDRVRRIRGVLSGSMSFVLARLEQGAAFSTALREAHALGLTEPDPRADLGGGDVARKLVICARAAGLTVDPAQVAVEPLVPDALLDGGVAAFLARCEALDAAFAERVDAARRQGRVLRHVGRIDGDGHGAVGLVEVAPDDALARLKPRDNCIEVVSERYADNPLVIQGPGAGVEVTAGAVLADLVDAVRHP